MSSHTPPLVLVADDEPSAATMLRHVFEREGYQVEVATNGIMALQIARRLEPDLILLDIMMPDMNGFEVLTHLRNDEQTAGIPTIVVSARANEPSDIALGLNIGADDYILKPFAPQELLARAKSKMRARQLEETLQQRTQELETLLRASEQFNQHLEARELSILIMEIVLQLLPGDLAILIRLDKEGNLDFCRQIERNGATLEESNISDEIANDIVAQWNAQSEFLSDPIIGLPHSIVLPITYGDRILGFLIIASDTLPYNQSHKLLFQGITRQAALALQNAELYEVQANYALHLEDMVAQRTQELKTTQQMLFRSEKLASIGHLAASIAHEINNPLQPIQLNLEYITEDIQAGRELDIELIEMTQGSVDRIRRIVRQLLEFTKSTDADTFTTIDLYDVISGVVKLNERVFRKNKIDLNIDIHDLPDIQANRDQLEQVFMNMLINSRDAMPDGGTITIRAWRDHHWVRIQFEDTGVGIDEEMTHKIFDPFISSKTDGTGLGLFVTYGIIEGHDGEIEVQSEIGKGTTFTISLPVDDFA